MHGEKEYSPYRLLALDDDSSSAELIARLARQCGYEARAITETGTLIERLGAWRPHVLTLDLRMPRVTGSDVISLLKIMNFPGDVIIVSGLEQAFLDEARRSAKFGRLKVAAMLRKPVDTGELRRLLNSLRRDPNAESDVLAS